jgi:hypothetical protein
MGSGEDEEEEEAAVGSSRIRAKRARSSATEECCRGGQEQMRVTRCGVSDSINRREWRGGA